MGSTVFPVASGGGAALPQGASSTVVSGYASKGGYKYSTSTPAGNYQVTVQAPSDKIYGIETANGVTVSEVIGGSTVPLSLASSDASITVGSYYPFQKVAITSINGNLRSMNGGNGLFVAITSTGYIYTSTDGLTWTNRTSGLEGNSQANGIPAYVNDRWVIPGTSNGIIGNLGISYSTDGVTWSYLALNAYLSSTIIQVHYAAGTWVAITETSTTNNGIAYTTSSFTTGWASATKPTTNYNVFVNYGSFRGTGYWLIGASSGVIFWGTSITSLSATTVTASDVTYIGSFKGNIIAAGNTGANNNAAGYIKILNESTGQTDLSSGWAAVYLADYYLMSTNFQIGINYGVMMCFPTNTSASSSSGTYPATTYPGNMVGEYRMLTSTNGFTWTVRVITRNIGNIRGAAITQANGIICFCNPSQWYMTTAYNSANIFINSTNLTTLN